MLRSALATLAGDVAGGRFAGDVAGERFAEINVRFFSKVDRESVITGVVSCPVETSVLANLPNPTLYRLGTTCTTRPTTSRPFRHTPPVTTQIARSPRLASPTSQLGCTSYATASAPLLQQ